MKVAYTGGFWATNIGNAFYNLGSIFVLEQVYGKENVYFVPDIANWFWKVKNNYEPLIDINVDICFFDGPLLNKYIKNYKKIFDSFKSKNIKLAFISAGASNYTIDERDEVLEFLSEYKEQIKYISTRDSQTYELYKDSGIILFDGLCTSMFLNNAVSTPKLERDYVVYNFSILHEPFIKYNEEEVLISKRKSFFSFQNKLNDFEIIRTNHETFSRFKWKMFNRPNMYYSDVPYGYIAIYKNAKYVFSDRVHTCAATLINGGTAMYIKGSRRSHDGRNNLFKRIRAEGIYEKPTKLNFEYINKEKEKMLDFLKNNI